MENSLVAPQNIKHSISIWSSNSLLGIHSKELKIETQINTCTWMLIAAAAAKVLQSCPTLCDPIDGSPSGSTVPGNLQARTPEWVAISFSNAWKVKSESEVAQSCPTLSNPMDCSPPGSSVHGICQARVPEWGAIAFSGWFASHYLLFQSLKVGELVWGSPSFSLCDSKGMPEFCLDENNYCSFFPLI